MVSIQIIAIFLLIFRGISVTFIGLTLWIQGRLFGKQIDFALVPNLSRLEKRRVYLARRVLFILSCIILLGNLIPVIVDAITIFGNNPLGRNPEVPAISIGYALSNALTAAFSALMIWLLYRIAGFDMASQK